MTFWSSEKIQERQKWAQLVQPYYAENIDCAAYTLTLGSSAYTSGDSESRKQQLDNSKTAGVWNLDPAETVTIQPGQFSLLLTEEVVHIPDDAVGFISVRATHKFAGLINVSGFHVDPGWKGRLIFGVFNAGPRELVFARGDKLFLLFFADLDRATTELKSASDQFERIPAKFIQTLAGDIPSLYKVNKKYSDLDVKIGKAESKANYSILAAGLSLTLALLLIGKVLFFDQRPSPTDKSVTSPPAPLSVASPPTASLPSTVDQPKNALPAQATLPNAADPTKKNEPNQTPTK